MAHNHPLLVWDLETSGIYDIFLVSQAPSRYYGLVCAVCFQDLLQQLEPVIYTHTALVVIVGLYTFESRIHKVAVELPNIIEGLVGVQLLSLPCGDRHYDEIHFSICIFTLTITGLHRFR